MSRELSLHTGGNSLSRAVQPDVGMDSDIGAVEFGAAALLFESDMPEKFREGVTASTSTEVAIREPGSGALVRAGEVRAPRSERETRKVAKESIASGMRELSKPRRRGDRIVQRRIGWQATPSLIVIATVERGLTRQADRRLKPSTEWLIERRLTYPCTTGKAVKRTGTVAFDTTEPPATPPSAAGAAQASQEEKVRQTFPEGAAALAFLPRAVRASVIARVPMPTMFDGTILLFSDPKTNEPTHRQIDVIRMDTTQAVVVQARALPGAQEWEVSQATYELGEPEIEQA